MSKGEDSGDFVAGFLFGAFVGAILALLFAPAPGEEIRGQLREKSIELKSRASDLGAEVNKRADELKTKGQSLLGDQRIRFQEAIEEGKKAAAQKKEDLLAQLEIARSPEDAVDLTVDPTESEA